MGFTLWPTGNFNWAGNTKTAQFTSRFTGQLTALETSPICCVHGRFKKSGKITAVIGENQPSIKWHLRRLNHIPATQFNFIKAQFFGSNINHAFNNIRRLRSSSASIWRYALCVAENTVNPHMAGRNIINTDYTTNITDYRMDGRWPNMGSKVCCDPNIKAKEISAIIKPKCDICYLLARMGVAKK